MFFLYFFLFFVFYELILSFLFLIMQNVFFFNIFFIIVFFLNFFLVFNKDTKFNMDIIFNFYKNLNIYLLNYYFLEFIKFITFFFKFKYKDTIFTTFIFIKSYLNYLFLIWRPLFKKWSYFGYFRSNRSKWIK